MSWGWALPGIGLVLLALFDMTLAVLHIERESPLSNRLCWLLWRGLVAASGGLSEGRRGRLLSWGIPLLVGSMIAFWVTLFVAGFGLIYLPAAGRPDQLAVKDRPPSPPLEDALYFSAVSFFTLGYGDIVPAQPLLRLAAATEGAFGLLTISLSVTYLVAIFPIITRKLVLAAALNQAMDGRANGTMLVRRYLEAGCGDALGERIARVHEELLYLGQAHAHYPLLFYVRPRAAQESFVRVLALVQGIVALRYVLDPDVHRSLVADPRLADLEEGLLYTLHSLEESIHLRIPARSDLTPDAAQAHADLAAVCVAATKQGLTPIGANGAAAGRAVAAYTRFRQATDPYIRAYAQGAAYPPEAIWENLSRRDRDADAAPVAGEGGGDGRAARAPDSHLGGGRPTVPS